MADDFSSAIFIGDAERDPLRAAQKDQRRPLPKRFYKHATFAQGGDGWAVLLDERPVRTPAGAPLALPSARAAELVVAEWAAQGEFIDPATMPVTRLVNSALDGVANQMDETAAEIVKFAGSDLVCYRAAEPAALVIEQAKAWTPVLDFARETLGARFVLAEGVMFATQPEAAVAAVAGEVRAIATGPAGALRLAALSVMTSLTGSALIALAVAQGAMGVEEGWRAAHVDEDFQIRAWGADEEAAARRERRRSDMQAAARLFALVIDAD